MRQYREFDRDLVRIEPNLPEREAFYTLVNEIWERGWLTNDGPLVREFEYELGVLTGAKHVIAVANGTLALMIAARALGIEGDFVCPSFTFIATPHALYWQGATPVFGDVGLSYNLDVFSAETILQSREITGIVATQVFGTPLNPKFRDIADEYDIPLLVDSAHTLGCDLPLLGDAEVLSFHATKIVHSFEGGAILTDNPAVAERCSLMRQFGFRGQANVVSEGINGKMSEVHAAMGILSLRELEAQVAHNREEYKRYMDGLEPIPDLSLGYTGKNFHCVPVLVSPSCPLTRDELVTILLKEGILARRYFYPGCHKGEPYRTLYPELHLPNTEVLCDSILILPNHSAGWVCEVLWRVLRR